MEGLLLAQVVQESGRYLKICLIGSVRGGRKCQVNLGKEAEDTSGPWVEEEGHAGPSAPV